MCRSGLCCQRTFLKQILHCTLVLQSNEGQSHRSFELIDPAFRGVVYTAEQIFSELFRDTSGMMILLVAEDGRTERSLDFWRPEQLG